MMFRVALLRAVAIGVATLLTFSLVFLREATSPSGEGYWTAMAPAPAGDVYLADEVHRELRRVHQLGGFTRIGPAPPGIFRALAADGRNLLLATEGRLYQSTDTGASWRAVLQGRFTAVAVSGSHELAGAWADALYVSDDSGSTWSRARVPPGDTEFETVIPGFAATLLGLLHSADGDHTWSRVPGIPDRITSVSMDTADLVARVGDWRGTTWLYDPDGKKVLRGATYPGGITSLDAGVTATTSGVFPDRGGPLHGREVTRVVFSGSAYWASLARGPIYVSNDGISWHLGYKG